VLAIVNQGSRGVGPHAGLLAAIVVFAGTSIQVITNSSRKIAESADELDHARLEEERFRLVATDTRLYFDDRMPSLLDLLATLASSTSPDERKGLVESLESLVVDAAESLYGRKEKDLRAVVLHLRRGSLLPGNYKGRFGSASVPWLDGTGRLGSRAIRLIREKRIVAVADPDDPRYRESLYLRPDDSFRSFIRVPIVAGEFGFGILWVDGRDNESLVEADVFALRVLAGILASGLAMTAGPDDRIPCSELRFFSTSQHGQEAAWQRGEHILQSHRRRLYAIASISSRTTTLMKRWKP